MLPQRHRDLLTGDGRYKVMKYANDTLRIDDKNSNRINLKTNLDIKAAGCCSSLTLSRSVFGHQNRQTRSRDYASIHRYQLNLWFERRVSFNEVVTVVTEVVLPASAWVNPSPYYKLRIRMFLMISLPN